jgi:hypothetical protein
MGELTKDPLIRDKYHLCQFVQDSTIKVSVRSMPKEMLAVSILMLNICKGKETPHDVPR